jgi:hypothetical protein
MITKTTKEDIVLYQPWGGLGDNLQFTTLPELYYNLGHNVYISTKNVCRNPEIYDLIWKMNPFVKGISDAEPNVGSCKGFDNNPSFDYVTNHERTHGLTDGYRIYPVIYYKPQFLPELADCLVYDVTAISVIPSDENIKKSFQHIFAQHPNIPIKKLQYTQIKNRETPYFSHDIYPVQSIYHMCDIMYSCKIFLCLFSGASVLASTIKQDADTPQIHVFHEAHFDHPTFYKFKNAVYSSFIT